MMDIIARLISFAVMFQALEMLSAKKYWSDDGIWTWKILKKDLKPFSIFLNQKSFMALMVIQTVVASVNMANPHFVLSGILFLSTLLTAIRWRGTFNGGSDYMTALILLAVFISGVSDNPNIEEICLTYIGAQVTLSYFIAGLVKIKERDWRSGDALRLILSYSNYAVDSRVKKLAQNKTLTLVLSWLVIILECLFPLALLDPQFCVAFIGFGLIFHLANFFMLGLNRFVFAWLAGYPALYYLSQ